MRSRSGDLPRPRTASLVPISVIHSPIEQSWHAAGLLTVVHMTKEKETG